MKVSTSRQATSTHAVRTVAASLRESAQAAIVRSFKAELNGCGPGPTDQELQTFARLAVAEQRLKRWLTEERTEHRVCAGA